MVSKVYEGINIDYINTMSHMASIVFEAKALEAKLEKDEANANLQSIHRYFLIEMMHHQYLECII